MPDPANPYAAPKNAGTVTTAARRHGADLTGLDLDKLRLLRGKSYHLNIIGGFMAFFTAIGVFCLIIFTLDGMNTDEGQELQIFACVIIALHGTAMLCAWLRPAWGRTPLFIISILGLANVPFGTGLGIFAIWALQGAAPLFGPNRYHHGDLDGEYQLRSARPSLRHIPPGTP